MEAGKDLSDYLGFMGEKTKINFLDNFIRSFH